jgi:hypothetical protein
LALACLFCVALLLAFCFRSGERLIQRERVRMRADVTAFSGGVSYARSLNVLASTQHAAVGAWVAAVLTEGAMAGWLRKLQKSQQAILDYGPWLSEATNVGIGAENGVLAVPAWNRPVLFPDMGVKDFSLSGFSLDAIKPGYHVVSEGVVSAVAGGVDHALERVGASQGKQETKRALEKGLDYVDSDEGRALKDRIGGLTKKLLPNWDLDWLLKTDHYEYKRRSDGQTVRVEKQDVVQNDESDGKGGRKIRSKTTAKLGAKYVAAAKVLNREFQLTLHDQGDHVITLVALQMPSDDPKDHRPGWVCALSQVQVGGGNQEMLDLDGAGYQPTFVPVRLFKDLQFSRQGLGLHGINGDLHRDGEWGSTDERLDAGQAGDAGVKLLDALPLPPALAVPLRRAAHAAEDLLAVQH